jgi:hypothetical protein
MNAAIFENPSLENLKVVDKAQEPRINDHDIMRKCVMNNSVVAGINPIDHLIIFGAGHVRLNQYCIYRVRK